MKLHPFSVSGLASAIESRCFDKDHDLFDEWFEFNELVAVCDLYILPDGTFEIAGGVKLQYEDTERNLTDNEYNELKNNLKWEHYF